MAIDGFLIKNLINEVKDEIIDNRLECLFQPLDDVFYASFYYRGKRRYLNFKLKPPYASFFLSEEIINSNNIQSNFLQTLKRQLEGYILKDIKQHLNDRVVIFEFEGVDLIEGLVKKQLILELMGRYNNLILLKDNIIIDAFIKNVSTTSRSIANKINYEFFPTNKKTFTLDAYKNMDSPMYLSKNYIGISPLLSKCLFKNKIDIFNEPVRPTKNLTKNQFYWFNLFDNNDELIFYETISELLLKNIEAGNVSKEKYFNFINKSLTFYSNKLINFKEDLKRFENDLNLDEIGNYIYSSGYNLDEKHSEIKTYDHKIIFLDVTKTLNENAQEYFKKYKKAKRAISHIEEQINENKNLYNLFLDFKYELETIKDDFKDLELALKPFGFKTKQKPSKKKSKDPYIKLNYLNNTFYIGRNSKENALVTHEIGTRNDFWFHIKDMPGSHVLLKGDLTDETLEMGAMLAAYYSKAKNLNKAEVNYTQVKNLKKIPKMPLSQVILTKYETINITIDNKAINDVLLANKLK